MADIIHGEAVRLTDRVRRITAPNAGPMTGPGTNTYLVGHEKIAVVDPGPVNQPHIDAILQTCGDKLCWILSTHTHSDHSPAAKVLAEATGAVVLGNTLSPNDGFQDESFTPLHGFTHDECFITDEFTLRALATPGHVDNHLCYLVEEEGLLLTGDHIMQGSTVVIIPPHGDMQDYINSLTLLLDYPLNALGPGHGHLIENPKENIQALIEHRLGREAKVVDVLTEQGQVNKDYYTVDYLTPLVYDDVDASLHPIARYSLWAHLIKLQKEQRAESLNDCWRMLE